MKMMSMATRLHSIKCLVCSTVILVTCSLKQERNDKLLDKNVYSTDACPTTKCRQTGRQPSHSIRVTAGKIPRNNIAQPTQSRLEQLFYTKGLLTHHTTTQTITVVNLYSPGSFVTSLKFLETTIYFRGCIRDNHLIYRVTSSLAA